MSAKVFRLADRQAPAAVQYGVPVALLILLFYVGNYFPQLYGSVLAWWHLMLACVGGIAVWAGFTGKLARLGRSGGALMAGALLLTLVSSVTAADLGRSLTNAWLVAGYLACFWLALTGAVRWERRWLTWTLAIGSIALALATLAIYAWVPAYAGFDVRSTPSFTFPLGNKNFTASYFLLAWPFFIGAAQGEDSPLNLFALYAGAVLSLICLVGSESRGAYLAAAVQVVLLAALLAGPAKRALGNLSRKAWLGIGAALCVAAVAVGTTTSVGERVLSIGRIASDVSDGGFVSDNSAAMRVEMWRGALAGYGERMLFGHGLGSVPTQFPADRMQSPRYPDVVNPQLHSTVFNVLYELGLLGVLLLAGVAVYVLRTFWRLLKQANPAPEAIGIGIGLLGYGFSLLSDFHWEVPSMSVTLALAAALLVAAVQRPSEAESTPLAVKPAAVTGGVLGAVVLGGGLYLVATKDQGAMTYDRGNAALSAGQYQVGIEAWREAVKQDPGNPFYKVALGSTLHYLTSDSAETPELRKLREEAVKVLSQSTETIHLSLAKIKIGNLLVKLGQPAKAIEPLLDATRMTYYAPVPHFYLGEAYAAAGQTDKAIKAYGTALAFSPAMQWAGVWYKPEHAKLRVAVAEHALSIYQRQGKPDEWLQQRMGQLLVMAGRRQEAEAMLKPLAAPAIPNRVPALLWLGEAAFRANDWQAAAANFAAVLTLDAQNGFANVRHAQAKAKLGDTSLVKAGFQALSAAYGAGATEAMITDPAVMAKASIPIGFDTRKGWANMAYRRAAPDQPFPNPIALRPEGMYFLGDEKPWHGFPRVTYRQLVAASKGDTDPVLANLPLD